MQSCSHNLVTFCAFGERASATDDFCDFLGNLRLTSLVSNTRQVGYQVISVVSRSLHCSSTSCGLRRDRKSTRLNSSHVAISYAVFCLKKKREEAPDASHARVKTGRWRRTRVAP